MLYFGPLPLTLRGELSLMPRTRVKLESLIIIIILLK
jgi:hypothetical protein